MQLQFALLLKYSSAAGRGETYFSLKRQIDWKRVMLIESNLGEVNVYWLHLKVSLGHILYFKQVQQCFF